MARISNRDKILTEGLRVVHERGFTGASVRDIVQAAGVPQGSFTNHFESKEAFGLEIIGLYLANSREIVRTTLRNDALPPLERLGAYLDRNREHLMETQMRHGCLYGNFSAEAGAHSEPIRARIEEIFGEVEDSVFYCLDAAAKAGEIDIVPDVRDLTSFFVSSLQGAILLAKAKRDPAPFDIFRNVMFAAVLRRSAPIA